MPRKFVDLSIYLENDVVSDPPAFAPKIQYFNHQNSFEQMAPFFPGLKQSDLPDGEVWAVEMVQLSTHNGTHLDAPYHFHSTMDKALGGKKPAWTIDEVPLEWCFQPGVKLDFRHFGDGYVVTAADVEAELKRIGHELKPLEIVVVNTRAGSRYGHNDYVAAGTVTAEAMMAARGTLAPWMASITFGGPDLRTVYIGSLMGTTIPFFRSPVAGLPMVHWK